MNKKSINLSAVIVTLILAILACNTNTSEKNYEPETSIKTEVITLQPFTLKQLQNNKVLTNGCLCSFSEIANNTTMIFADDRASTAVIKINNTLQQLQAVIADSVSGNTVFKQYKNNDITITITGIRSAIDKADEGTAIEAKLQIKNAKGELILEKSVWGICAC